MKMEAEKFQSTKIFCEDIISYCLYKYYFSKDNKIFFKVSQNINVKTGRGWDYWCAPEVDVIEVTPEGQIIAYEIKGFRKGKHGESEPPALYDGISQALAYFNLPYIAEGKNFNKFGGGAFDFVYLIHARSEIKFPRYEKRIFDLLSIGFILSLPNGKFEKVKEALQNPLQSKEAKKHFLINLDTLEKFSLNSKIFRKIKGKGEKYFSNL